ncbi:Rft protein-domain-containing protein [Tuber brumale]|nr:Rft protein-domain-containing protein [Tuber brumale]
MPSKPPKQPPPRDEKENRQSLLSASAEGAKFLILLQVASRLLTFLVNQLLLQYLSPSLLGISVQLELFMISILYFSRESLRTALQRQPSSSATTTAAAPTSTEPPKAGSKLIEGTPAAHHQTVINLSLLTLPLGLLFAATLSLFYAHSFASSETASQPFFYESVCLYALATIVELAAEPYFALAQLGLRYKARAAAESAAAFIRCVLTCGITVAVAKGVVGEELRGRGVGPLGFAAGQVGYAVALLGVYVWCFWGEGGREGWGSPPVTRPCWLKSRPQEPTGHSFWASANSGSRGSSYHLTYFHKPLTSLAASMWLQSALKHLLTQGDSLLITYFTTNHAQGIYALSSNYGSLIARMLFQPIEESSRNLFAKLLSSSSSSSTTPSRENITSAKATLQTLLKLYLLLSTFFVSLAAPFAPFALSLIASRQWTAGSDAGETLSAFCYYIPLLAINGVTEAFVQSVANERELAGQSAWMFAFSLGFAAVGWVFLKVLGWGARGLVAANGVNMLVRILWSVGFVRGYFARFEKEEEGGEGFKEALLPGWVFLSTALGVGALARGIVSEGGSGGVVKMLASAGGLGIGLLGVCERTFFTRCYQMVKSRGE